MNERFVQLKGPFSANENVFNKLDVGTASPYFNGCGILAHPGHIVYINGQECEIGLAGVLQYNDIDISSLAFKQNEPATTKIDCVVK